MMIIIPVQVMSLPKCSTLMMLPIKFIKIEN